MRLLINVLRTSFGKIPSHGGGSSFGKILSRSEEGREVFGLESIVNMVIIICFLISLHIFHLASYPQCLGFQFCWCVGNLLEKNSLLSEFKESRENGLILPASYQLLFLFILVCLDIKNLGHFRLFLLRFQTLLKWAIGASRCTSMLIFVQIGELPSPKCQLFLHLLQGGWIHFFPYTCILSFHLFFYQKY